MLYLYMLYVAYVVMAGKIYFLGNHLDHSLKTYTNSLKQKEAYFVITTESRKHNA